jgi:hypothetical protein
MQMSDRLSVSGLSYSTWAAKMVKEGKLVEPQHNKTIHYQTAAFGFDLSNMKCGVLASTSASLERTKRESCVAVRLYAGASTNVFRGLFKNLFCQDAEADTCITMVDVLFDVSGGFVDGGLAEQCDIVMDEILAECRGGVGGTAEIVITRNDGQTFSGSVGLQNYEDDPGATCPANPITDTEICTATSG